MAFSGVSTAQGFTVEDTTTNSSYFTISEIKLSITSVFSLQIMSYLGASDIIYNDVIDNFIPEILMYEMSVIVSLTEKLWTVLFNPFQRIRIRKNNLT